VQGVLSTKDALGPVTGGMVLSTLIVYLAIYAFLTVAYVTTLFFMARKAGKGDKFDPQKEVIVGGERHTAIKAAD
jgi:cytochrome d ubiquinol oxidase subunit I